VPNAQAIQFERARGVTHVSATPHLAQVELTLPHAQRLGLLRALADRDVPVFLVTLTPEGLSFVVRQTHAERCRSILADHGLSETIAPQKTLLSVIAGAMRDLSGVIVRIYDTLHAEGIPIRQTGDAYDAVHVLVDAADAPKAQAALERSFDQEGHP
jgi:aspartokinase